MATKIRTESGGDGAKGASRKMSYEEFLKWDGVNQHAEWVDGQMIFMSPVSKAHQDVACFLLTLLNVFVEARQLGVVLFEPFQMKTSPDLPGRAPDILFVARENAGRLKAKHLDGPADLASGNHQPG